MTKMMILLPAMAMLFGMVAAASQRARQAVTHYHNAKHCYPRYETLAYAKDSDASSDESNDGAAFTVEQFEAALDVHKKNAILGRLREKGSQEYKKAWAEATEADLVLRRLDQETKEPEKKRLGPISGHAALADQAAHYPFCKEQKRVDEATLALRKRLAKEAQTGRHKPASTLASSHGGFGLQGMLNSGHVEVDAPQAPRPVPSLYREINAECLADKPVGKALRFSTAAAGSARTRFEPGVRTHLYNLSPALAEYNNDEVQLVNPESNNRWNVRVLRNDAEFVVREDQLVHVPLRTRRNDLTDLRKRLNELQRSKRQ